MSLQYDQYISRRDFLKLVAATTAALTIDYPHLEALAAEVEPKEQLPVVIIGGGLGGLSAAALLARHGFPVTLVEQHEIPGGYATSFDRAAGKYTFDVSLHATASAQGGLRPALEGAGILDKVETVELPELCRIITPDHDLIWPQRNPEAITEQLTQIFPDQAPGIRGFFGEMLSIIDEGMKPFDPDSWWDKLLFPFTHKNMWAIRKKTLGDVLDNYVQDAKARSILSVFWPYYGLPPSTLSGFYYCIATAAYMRFGGHYIKQRSQDLSYALMEAIEAGGGSVLLEAEATAIRSKDGTVTGVDLADGRHIKAKAVVSNASVPATMKMLAKNSESGGYSRKAQAYLDKLRAYKPSLSSFIVWLGLNKEIRGKVKGYEIFVLPNYDPEQSYRASLVGDPLGSGMTVTIYDNAYEGYSTQGSSTVSIMMLSGYEPWAHFETDYFAGRKKAYYKQKERITKTLIDRTEKLVIPGLSSMIEVVDAATPLTNVRYTKNPEGAIYGYEQSLKNSFMTRLGNTTPFEGIYLASAWSNPGGGFQPCLLSGVNAFKALVKNWGGKV